MPITEIFTPPVVSTGLQPYTGAWTWQQASHLLRRASFGPRLSEIEAAISAGMNGTVATLLAPIDLPGPPLNHTFPSDPNVPIGSTWINAPFVDGVNVSSYRWSSLRGWLFQSIQDSPVTVREKMMLFWNNHFGMSDVGDHRVQYQYVTLFREQATGNFKQLVKDITIHPSMLRFLNGDQNRAGSPNENFARELLELFTIGKGAQVGPGDYTNYTDTDVAECARILTGWRNSGFWSTDPENLPHSYFQQNRHDTGDKTLSHRFDNAVITNADDQEYSNLIDLIFTKDEVARFICRKLYRYFVYYKIDATIEADMIEPMAQLMIANNYDVAPVLDALFKSQHFYDISIAGDVIKNPLEYVMSAVRPTEWGTDFDLELRYQAGGALHWWARQFEMDFFYPPSVSGWPVWYQAPSFNRLWLNSSTLQQRVRVANGVGGSGIWVNGMGHPFDWLTFISTFDNAFDPNALVATFAGIFLPQPLLQIQLDELKDFLIPGLPDFEWTDEYGLHIQNPNDMALRTSVENKLKSLVRALFRMAEFQIN